MRLATKRALDFYAGRPLLTVLQVAAWVIGKVVRRDHGTFPVRTVLVTKFQGLGSLIIAKPALAALRKHHPNARIIFWGTTAMRPLAREMPEFDEVLTLDDRSFVAAALSLVGSLVHLWRARVDWAFDLEAYSRLSTVLVTLTLARNRAGFALEQLRSRRVHTHLVYFNRYSHIGEAYARLIGQVLPADTSIDVNAFGGWRFACEPLPSLQRPYFLFNVHAGDLALERRWPREYFKILIDALLARRPDATVVLIGHGPREVEYTAPLATSPRIIDLSGQLTLVETIRAVSNAELVVTNDTAPLHMALSSQARVVGLFGPTRAETYLTPNRGSVAGAQVHLYCSPCVHHWEPLPCMGDNQCMKQLTPRVVLERCYALLGLAPPEDGEAPVSPGAATGSTYYPGLVYHRPRRQEPASPG